ncbi:hypothetical protein GQ600_5844 [Phytophthora cactorum]|nr:hypothetical protein GQ600_1 [Phytophthora cactorum]KAF1780842.1 hypothetical protein GQ600_5844 [Phytophthora cactorum]
MDRELRVKAVTAGSTSRHSKQGRSDGLVHPQSVQGDEQDDQQIEPEAVTTVNELRKAGAKKKHIIKYIFDNSKCNPSNQDVHNLVQKLKKWEDTATSSAKRIKQWMIEFSRNPVLFVESS